jgi:rhodanese-related sulfurtransferase
MPEEPLTVDVDTLADWLVDGEELALLDAREQGVFLTAHLFHAACIPLSHLELQLPALVPRRDTRVVWCDGGSDGLARRAAVRSAELGWTGGRVLDGGVAAWSVSGREVYAGVNVPSKAFGEHVEHTYGTPRMPAAELRSLLDTGADVVVLDSRPIEEFRRMSIPTGTACPGAELVHRVKAVVRDPETLVVVNCAGRTRSIIGSQSLINAGLENRVVALENGTMGWELAGFDVERDQDVHAPDPPLDARRWAERSAAEVGRRFGVAHIDHDRLAEWRAEGDRTTYLLDVRTPDEYRAGHLKDSIGAPGGQLVQATDEYVATRNARLVLVDDTGVRATMTASWLRQMGWHDAVVLDGAFGGQMLETGNPARTSVGRAPTITVADLAAQLDDGDESMTVVDIGTSLKYRDRGHIPGAWWGVRSRLDETRAAIGDARTVVLTSTDGQLAKLAVADAQEQWPDATVLALAGGNRGWRHAGHDMELGFTRPTTAADDVWYKPYDHDGDVVRRHMEEYLTWEIALVEQLGRDSTVSFPTFE